MRAIPSWRRLAAVAVCIVAVGCRYVRSGDTARIITGDRASAAFVYQGRPVHPLCVLFSQEGSSRGTPNELAECTDPATIPEIKDGEAFVFLPERRGYSGYRVLARQGDRFLLTLESSGGGSGAFSDLSWVKLETARIRDVKDVLGGDRCGGGLGHYRVNTRVLSVSAAASTLDLLRLGGLDVADPFEADLRYGPPFCDGYVNYEYDLAADSLQVRSVTIVAPDARNVQSDRSAMQSCFDDLARRAGVFQKPTVALPELKTLVAHFRTVCHR